MNTIGTLVLEDDELSMLAIVKMLQSCGIEPILEAANGQRALELLERNSVQLLISDLHTPGMDGIQLMRHVACLERPPDIILVSGLKSASALLLSTELMARDLGLRVLGTLHKPVSLSKLRMLSAQAVEPPRERKRSSFVRVSPEEVRTVLLEEHLQVLYQPIVSLTSRDLIGVEALVRWNHPERGLLLPETFLSAAQKSKSIHRIGEAVLKRALEQVQEWTAQGLEFAMNLNYSGHELSNLQFADSLEAVVARTGMDFRRIVIEVTEESFLTGSSSCLENLTRLRMKGFGLSIDDFGVGNSSMKQLGQVPFTEMKLDRFFVQGALQHGNLRAILKNTLKLAQEMKLFTVGEGIESAEQWEFMKQIGCDAAQGYWIAEPMPGSHIKDWYRQWIGNASVMPRDRLDSQT